MSNMLDNPLGLLLALVIVSTMAIVLIAIGMIMRNEVERLQRLVASNEFIVNSGFVSSVKDLVRLKDLKEQIERDKAQGWENRVNKDYYERNKEAAWKTVRAYLVRIDSLVTGKDPTW